MTESRQRTFSLPTEKDLDLHRLSNAAGIEISVLPNGCIFAIEHVHGGERTLINQVCGSPLGSGIGHILLRDGVGASSRSIPAHAATQISGADAKGRVGAATDRFIWDGETGGVRHRVTLWLHPREPLWLWRVELENRGAKPVDCDAIFVQDLGLSARGFVLSNEAYTSQYIDHMIGRHPAFGPVIMSRQNMGQFGRNPWIAHGCLEGAIDFATDGSQLFRPFRNGATDALNFGCDLESVKIQGEMACAAIQSRAVTLAAGAKATLTFFGFFEAHHAAATSDADLARIDAAASAVQDFQPAAISLSIPPRSILQYAKALASIPDDRPHQPILDAYPERRHEEWLDGEERLSFFVPDGPHNRHVVCALKEALMPRRHGSILRSGDAMLPDDRALSVTCWMHGVFAAQLTIGNTGLHKLFSVSRDPYNVTRASGLRILADRGDGWRLLTVPWLFEMGLSDCRWIYRFEDGTIVVHGWTSAEDTAMQWDVTVTGKPCRFLIFGHLVMGERDFEHAGVVEVDEAAKRISLRPDADWLWGRQYPRAVHHLVTSTPGAVETIGSGALLFDGAAPRSADAYAAIRTHATDRFSFALVGSLTDPDEAERLAVKYERGVDSGEALEKARAFWSRITLDTRFPADKPETAALATIFPWFAQNAIVHLTVPRGLEQYTAAAWGTRDVCQGPVEFLLPLGHHQPVCEILRIVFAQQFEASGDWPQWFMLDPYRQIRDPDSHGDVIVWPLKALCDYIEASGDMAFLDEPLPWTQDDFGPTAHGDPVSVHVEKLLATVRQRFISGTHLIRYGLGDWNNSLQPADPAMRDWMVSSWTVALLYQQIGRYAGVLRRGGRSSEADELGVLTALMREDFNRYLMPDGTVAGYTLFHPGSEPEWLLHPRDRRTGVSYSLIPMTRSIIAGLFTPEQVVHHLRLIREHLLFWDGARLMDRPVAYSGGLEINFRRAESATFFGREIGLMYSHAHLRYCEALGVMGEAEAARAALRLVNPLTVEGLPRGGLRQRNAYFSSSDAAFRDRAQASAEWERMRKGEIVVRGGWRIYSSGPGIFTRLALLQMGEGGSS